MQLPVSNPTDLIDILADRCATLDFLVAVYRAEPSAALVGPIVRELAEEPLDELPLSRGQQLLRDYALKVRTMPVDQTTADLAAEYVALFFSSWRRVLAPYESVYRSQQHLLLQVPSQQMSALYASEGLHPEGNFTEPADHIALELAFLSHLCRCSLDTVRSADFESALKWIEKQRAFLHDHLLAWALDFCRDLDRMTHSDFYRGVAWLTIEFLEAEPAMLAELTAALVPAD